MTTGGTDLPPLHSWSAPRPEPLASPSMGPRKYYPSVSLRQGVKGLSKVGQTKTVRVKVKVRSIELSEGESPRLGLELRGIEES